MTPKIARNAFTLVELLIVVVIIVILIGLLMVLLRAVQGHHPTHSRSRDILRLIDHALEQYRSDFGAYPPDNFPTTNGSEILAYYLCSKIKSGKNDFGPYLESRSLKDSDQNGLPEFLSPFNSPYVYKLIGDRNSRALLIDPGPDQKLGGTIDPQKGFLRDNSEADKDNVYNIEPAKP